MAIREVPLAVPWAGGQTVSLATGQKS